MIKLGTPQIVECVFRLFEDFSQPPFTLSISGGPFGCFESRLHKGAEWTEKGKRFRACPLTPVSPAFRAFPYALDRFFFPFEFGCAFGCQMIDPPPILTLRLNHPLILELLQCR